MQHDNILIVDFGSQVTQLIARRVREFNVLGEIVPYHSAFAALQRLQPRGVILSGGPASVHDANAPTLPPEFLAYVLQHNIPVLGICYGQQLLCHLLGGKITPANKREFGRAALQIVQNNALLPHNAGQSCDVWMSHGDSVTTLPPHFKVLAHSEGAPFATVADEERRLYGVQFHPEVTHTPDGGTMLKNFVLNIAQCNPTWSAANLVDTLIEKIRAQVQDDVVICGLSGGVDSAVTAVLTHKAIGDKLTCIFVDTGLLRQNEAHEVVQMFRQSFGIKLIHIDAGVEFFEALHEISDPEIKRKTIGRLFIEIFERTAREIGGAKFLAQGTLYPDVIESVSVSGGPSVTIKSHHNVGGLPERMNMQLLEPLRLLFKDEVRALGRALDMPQAFIERHPFPGPGLAIRIPGNVTPEKADILRQADAIFLEEIRKAGLYNEIWQAFAVLLPVRTVGVMGDGRTYDYVCALRAVVSVDGMTVDSYAFSHSFLTHVTGRIIGEVRGINRVVYDVTSKPPGTIEWE